MSTEKMSAVAEEEHIQKLRKLTSVPDWAFEREPIIPDSEWDRATRIAESIEPWIPRPIFAPCGDGSVHARFTRGDRGVRFEMRGEEIIATTNIGRKTDYDYLSSEAKIGEVLHSVFGKDQQR